MRIGITTFGGDGGKSGISQYIINLLREFPSIDDSIEYDLIVYNDEREIFAAKSNDYNIIGYGDDIRSPVKNILWHLTELPRLCSKRKYDVLFLPAGNRRLPWSVPCPAVGTVHDFSSLHVKGKYDRSRMYYISKVLPLLIKRLNHVLTVSESSKKDIVEYAHVPERRVTVTPLAADSRKFFQGDQKSALERLQKKFPISSQYILFISRIEHPGKNHINLIRAFAKLKKQVKLPHQLVLAGSDWLRANEIHAEAEQSGFADEILFTGFVNDSDIPDLYFGADLFVFPSLYEGFGIPLLEAMACGLPVACSNISSLPEVAGDSALLFDPYSIDSITDAMCIMLTDRSKHKLYAQKGLDHSKNFTWRKTAEMTLKVLKETALKLKTARSGSADG